MKAKIGNAYLLAEIPRDAVDDACLHISTRRVVRRKCDAVYFEDS
jgi:hypothetical protein